MPTDWLGNRIETMLQTIERNCGKRLDPTMRELLVLTYKCGFCEGIKCAQDDEPEVLFSKLEGLMTVRGGL